MAPTTAAVLHFNRGMISRYALARVDVKRAAFSAETMTNWMPRVMGSMMLRPGWQYLGGLPSAPRMLPFVFATSDVALVEVTNLSLRLWIGDRLLSRPPVSTVVLNGGFDANLNDWTDNDEAGAASTWATGGYMQLVGDGTNGAIRDQQVAVAAADRGTEHALRIVINRGPVTLRVGSTFAGEEYITETELATGTHSLAFTPTGDFNVRFLSRLLRITLVASCTVEPAGGVSLPAPWSTSDVVRVRADQSGDILFVACRNFQQRKIERRAARSWSIVLYLPTNGPFRTENLGPITIATSALSGNVTLTASAPTFKSTQVGGLVRVVSAGQRVSSSISAANTFTNTVRVVGVGEARRYTWTISGVWVGTVTLQRSVGTVGFWEDVAQKTGNATESDNDGQDNQVIYYRLGFKAGDYTSGTAVCTITYTLGSIAGVARITDFTSNLLVSAEVLTAFGGTDASSIWSEGSWSDRRGWPTSVAFYEGRLWWAGKNGVWGSVSDAYDSFDPDFEGTAGPINRTIGSGPVDDINWILPLQRLLLGAQGAELSVRSTAFDEPLSPTNFNVKEASTQGSAAVPAVKVDSRGIYVQRGGTRVYELGFDTQSYDYGSTDLTALIPEIGYPGIRSIAVQRQPDTRVHCVRTDGTVAIAVIDRVENVLSWQEVVTDGDVIDAVVLPGDVEDRVYYVVQRALSASGVTSLAVTAGSGYTSRPTLSFAGGGGSNTAATVNLTLVSLTVAAGGAGYAAGDFIQLTGGGTVVFDAVIRVDTVDGSGAVLTGSVASGGNYVSVPANPVSTIPVSGTGCTITATWGLGAATIVSTGGAYTSAPTVSVNGGGGAGGAIVATIASSTQTGYYLEKWAQESECVGGTLNKQADSFVVYEGEVSTASGGFVSALSVTPGVDYTSPPTLSFSGGGGSGAAATIVLAYQLGFFALAALGSGYSKGDTLTLVGGTYTRPARFEVIDVFGGGQINGATFGLILVDGGAYSVVPASGFGTPISVTGGTGSGATFQGFWELGEATITAPGSGYTTPPTVTLAGGAGRLGSVNASISIGTTTVPTSANSIGGLSHLEGKQVVVWGDGADLSPETDGVQTTYTVTGGVVALDTAVSEAVIGLPYTAQWKSAKLSTAAEQMALNQRKRITQLGLMLADVHAKGIKFGPSFDHLNPLPDIQNGAYVPYETIHAAFDYDLMEFPGGWDTDARLCLQAQAPRPCKVLAVVMAIEGNPKA